MSIYKNLESIRDVAIIKAKAHNVNYNIILMNPDKDGKFNIDYSTYEFVTDSYFDKDRSNVILLETTDSILLQEQIQKEEDSIYNNEIFQFKNDYLDLTYDNPYMDYQITSSVCQYIRETPKQQNNQLCSCGSQKKYKKCCK